VFRSIQIAPVWRAERPQKGRYRQFVQCDIDIIGEPGIQAEAELLVASLATVDALGLADATIRVNDRRLLIGMLTGFGFEVSRHDEVLITIDKLDKLGPDGVVAELTERGADPDAVAAFRTFLLRPQTREFLPFGERAIRKALPDGADGAVVADLVTIGDAVAAARGVESAPLVFDPFLVRGMGYYTGPIFELAHPSVSYSLGGGGRYDGMIGRFLGSEVPATGFSLGFERLVDLVEPLASSGGAAVALVHGTDAPLATLLALQTALVARGDRARLVRRAKNTKLQLENLADQGFTSFAFLGADAPTELDALELRPLD
jgi:histidyl-tRNA synthetase